jgi:alanine dehydrogenase
MSQPVTVDAWTRRADLLIGAVLVPGAAAPKVVSRELVSQMKDGSVIVDVAVDQGGCVETTEVTTHGKPTFVVDGVVHYGVANMPGAVPRTSTFALTNVTLPYLLDIVRKGFDDACRGDAALARGVNTHGGHVTCEPVAEAQGLEFTSLDTLL